MKIYILLLSVCFFYLPVHAQLTIDRDSAQASLFESPVQLSEVIVNARMKNIQDRGLGNFQINPQHLKVSPLFMGERDLIKTLQYLPGISAGMEGSSQLNIRGGTNDQILYLLDDVPVYNQNHTFGFFSMFNSDAIGSVELYKGGIPTQYGDKLSGVVSVSLKDGDYKKHNTSVSLGLLALTLASDSYIIQDKISYNIAARRSFLDLLYNGITSLSGEADGGTPMISFYDINSKFSWKVNAKSNLSWQIYNGFDDIYGANKTKSQDSNYSEKLGYGWKTFMTSLRYYTQIKPNLLSSSTIYYTTLDNFNYYKSKITSSGIKQRTENGTSSLLTEFGGKIAFEHHISEKNKLNYGLESTYQIFTPNYVYRERDGQKITYHSDKLKLFKLSGYINDEFSYKQYFIQLGIRTSLYDNRNVRRFAIEPRIRANYYLNNKNKFMIALDRMYQPVNTINEIQCPDRFLDSLSGK